SPRLAGGASVTSLPSIRILPPVVSSSPAISRSSVDFPQPDGPTNTTNSPSSMSRSMPGITSVVPKDFFTLLREMLPMVFSDERFRCCLFHRAKGEAAYKLLLREPAHDEDGRDRQRRGRRKLRPEQALRARIRRDEGGERRCL